MDDSNKTSISDLQMYIAIYYRSGTLDITQQIYHQTINKPLLTNSEPFTNNYTTYEHTNENEFCSAGRSCAVPPRRTPVVKKLPHELGARCSPEQQLYRTQRAKHTFRLWCHEFVPITSPSNPRTNKPNSSTSRRHTNT